MLLNLLSFFLHIKFLLGPYAYVPVESIDCILLSSLALSSILSTFPVNTLCFYASKSWNFNINLLFFMNSW